jgi:hypothetical protein
VTFTKLRSSVFILRDLRLSFAKLLSNTKMKEALLNTHIIHFAPRDMCSPPMRLAAISLMIRSFPRAPCIERPITKKRRKINESHLSHSVRDNSDRYKVPLSSSLAFIASRMDLLG